MAAKSATSKKLPAFAAATTAAYHRGPAQPSGHGHDHGGWPPVDAALVEPETRQEMVRGELIEALPANEPHAEHHFNLNYLIGASIAPGYVGASDLLTRWSDRSNFATDTCVRREGIDPSTGHRYLEELAFEVVSEQSLRHITIRAEDLANRGVRRILAVFVKVGEVREWDRDTGAWRTLPLGSMIVDPTLVHPLPVSALLDAATADAVVVSALLAKRSPALLYLQAKTRIRAQAEGRLEGRVEGRVEGRAEGLVEGRAEGQVAGMRRGVEAICAALAIELTAARLAQLQRLDGDCLETLLGQLTRTRAWPDI